MGRGLPGGGGRRRAGAKSRREVAAEDWGRGWGGPFSCEIPEAGIGRGKTVDSGQDVRAVWGRRELGVRCPQQSDPSACAAPWVPYNGVTLSLAQQTVGQPVGVLPQSGVVAFPRTLGGGALPSSPCHWPVLDDTCSVNGCGPLWGQLAPTGGVQWPRAQAGPQTKQAAVRSPRY